MTTQFPTALDNLTNPTGTQSQAAGPRTHSQQHGDLNDAIEAVQAKVGINGSTDPNSTDYKLRNTPYTADNGGVARSLQLKADEHRSPQDHGAVGNGVADDTSKVAGAITALTTKGRNVLHVAGDYLVTALSNPRGIRIKGPGRILKAITGGNQQLNSECDEHAIFTGGEYLYAFHSKLFAKDTSAKVVCSGDSTTFGTGSTAPWQFVQAMAAASYRNGHYASFVNSGNSGRDTGQWVSTYLTADIALNPDLYVVRWGINDPFNGRDIDAFATSLRQGLAQVRASKSVAQCSILLMVPNSTSDTPNGRDEKWYEQVRLVCRQAARDYQCALFDTYMLLRDSRPAAGLWMDNSFGDGRAIHPANIMNAWIAERVADFVFPSMLAPRLGDASNASKVATSAPSTYPYGWSMYSAPSGDTTFPIQNAHVVTFKSLNGVVMQWCVSGWATGVTNGVTNNGGLNYAQAAMRMGQHVVGTSDVWYDWTSRPAVDLTSLLVNGWVPFATGNAPYAAKNGNIVSLHGLIKSGTVTAGTTLLTLAAGWRPRNTVEAFLCAMGPTGTTTPVVIHVANTGIVTLQSAGNAAFVSLSGISFVADN